MANTSRPVWHPYVHEQVLKEELYFFFLSSYGDFDEFTQSIKSVLDQQAPERYSLYYVFGNFDLVVRIWCRREDFRSLNESLKSAARPYSGNVDTFDVDRITYLWCNAPEKLPASALDDVNFQSVGAIQRGDYAEMDILKNRNVLIDFLNERDQEFNHTKSLLLFDFKRESSAVVDIVHEELSAQIADLFPDDRVSLYFGTGIGTLLIKQVSNSIERFLELGELVRKRLRLLRVRSSTYIVSRIISESDNGDVTSQSAIADIRMPSTVEELIKRYPEAERLPEDDLYAAMSFNSRVERWVKLNKDYAKPGNWLLRSFIRSNRGQLMQSITEFAHILEGLRNDDLPILLESLYGDDWQNQTEKFLRDNLDKAKPVGRLSLGEFLHLVREINKHILRDPRLDLNSEWETAVTSFIKLRNDVQHNPDSVSIGRTYEAAVTIDALVNAIEIFRNVVHETKSTYKQEDQN